MGHRHLYSSSPMLDGEPDQNWNHMHTDQQYVNLDWISIAGRSTTSDNGSFIYPMENMSIDSISFPSHWNTAPRSNGYTSTSLNIEAPSHQTDISGTSNDHFLHPSSGGMFYAVSENYVHQPSSSNYDRQSFPVADGGFIDLAMGNGRGPGPHKRKSPGVPSVCERGSTSRCFNAASANAADRPTSSELRPEKPTMDSLYMPWDHVNMTPDHVNMTPSFRGRGLSIRGESSLRNVRSRSTLDLESNLARTHLSNTHSHNSFSTGPQMDHSTMVDLSTQTSGSLTRDWSQMSVCLAHGRVPSSDANAFNHEANHFLAGNGSSNAPVDVGGFHNEFGTSRNPTAPQSFHSNCPAQPARGVRSNYSQRSTPTFRASSSLRLGRMAPSDDGLHMVAESYSSRHPRPLTTIGWHSNDRNGRSRIHSDRYRALADEVGLNDQFSFEGFMIVDRTSLYGRNMIDQHRDMRMDIDNMSYEELLALGERIGHVSTGLSEDLISKYLTETIYCSSEPSQEEEACAICLEEYKNVDDVGTLKACGHDYHVSCIRKWLSMKKVCPICKASALPEETKDK
ncbi:probable E3 ubiquitin-protein ligase RHG1A isoform X1 [Vigna radiata var. radiata]|uniref:RING-type E3 ubiquitin transferase n=1 Tax=Vigna radiata var. radiata TaxID=3916 RepID=A0A3Q0FCK2_VIGRR|nr:probable E3 ubiquitin-protein ligase RHG1A isoform X1 [Vigna radiata var. radiata]XP_022640346.1 probable E3 ubiquitin-protein ligase RHG1A isoform X1 [Vigna radiata var. radiata]XP_022640347.1 probable E3 ubiquitin-protein ligase RHG1A isoform X1 [Vigna radiata var. radiata]XP_022640348.1 probable E3 ubiquitin-protein ligase RHG1A isoform X1 [Vigna radiata var. radiata]XP_022640349.1 probable E3 ubiquitin-protein ligase RHG1A isoform X1 [Vigna radiata var. radiata]XP_022640350.1 probable E